jgi:uncharacterized protein
MEPATFILALLEASPEHRIEGKKRLQKLAYLLKESGANCNAKFKLKDYGPYSYDLDEGAQLLSLFGDIEQTEMDVGYANNIMTVFRLSSDPNSIEAKLDERARAVLNCISRFRTVELEVAATIRFFESSGFSHVDAIEHTKRLKPTKSNPDVLKSAQEALECLR